MITPADLRKQFPDYLLECFDEDGTPFIGDSSYHMRIKKYEVDIDTNTIYIYLKKLGGK